MNWRSPEKYFWRPFFFRRKLAPVSLVLGLGLEHSCPWPWEVLFSERLSLALASDFFVSLALASSLGSSTPTLLNASKVALNHVGVHVIAKNRLRSAKNVIFCLLCILVDRPMGGGGWTPKPLLRTPLCGRQVTAWLEDRKVPSLSPGQGNLVNKMWLQLHIRVDLHSICFSSVFSSP